VAAIAALLDARAAVTALRRSLPRGGPGVVTCRTPAALRQLLHRRIVEAVVFAPRVGPPEEWAALRADFPAIPIVVYAPFRPDDGELLTACRRQGVAGVAVEGVDDPVVGELVRRVSLAAGRRTALADAPRLLRLADPLQRTVWELIVDRADQPVATGAVAARLGVSREHLSRQFGAGGAPNLKRVIDFLRVVVAAQLLHNPGYTVARVAALLSFASSSHLGSTARRIAALGTADLPGMEPGILLGRFARGHTRSRL
ncbi:MAG TPA: AraC family transcriptional regulator, partial [Gemmatimonadales bacterium]|nr:AraC family transcriptional regulator [Gemmatimonadales bacterium]